MNFKKGYENIKSCLRTHDIRKSLEKLTLDYYKLKKEKFKSKNFEYLKELSKPLRKMILFEIHIDFIMRFPLFIEFNEDHIYYILSKLKQTIFLN